MANCVRHTFYVLILLMTGACTITVKNPGNRFDSPETTGKLYRFKAEAGMGGANNVVLSSDYALTPPSTDNPQYEKGTQVFIGAGMGLGESVDLEVRSTGALQVKFQMIGDPRLSSKADNFAMALTAAAGYDTQSGTDKEVFTTDAAKYSMSGYTLDAALLLGYRPADWCLLYFGPFVTHKHFTGRWEKTAPTTSTLDFSGNSDSTGGSFGLEFGTQLFQIKAEGAYANVKSGSVNTGRFHAGAAVAFNFGKK